MNPFSLNVLGQFVRDRQALRAWVQAAQPQVLLIMDSPELALDIRALSPGTTVIHRSYNPNDHQMWKATSPGEWLAAHKSYAVNGVVLQVLNEPTLDDAAQTWLEELVSLCPSGVRLALPHFGVGNPYEKDIEAGRYDWLLRLVCGTRHILALHEYFYDDPIKESPYLCGRFQFWLQRAEQLRLPKPKIIITEFGRDAGAMR